MSTKVKELPTQERPYEKCLSFGPEYLTDAELLAIIIRTGTKGENSMFLANKILKASNSEKGLLGLCSLSRQELMNIKGVGKVKAIQIQCICELARRFSRLKACRGLQFTTPESIAEYYMQDLCHEKQEKLLLLMLNAKNKLIESKMIFQGTVNASYISPREIFIECLRYEAVNLILIHNHPSGDATPSKEDVLVTKRIKQVSELIGLQLLDHIIIGDHCYTSMRESGVIS